MSQLRNFEISIWTLQDDFVATIESAWIKAKGKTQNASMNLNIDGTQQLTFSVPMYYFMNGQKISNPAWITFSENKVLLNTRKVKVILNKQTDDEEIYEFVIDKVTERHEHDELICDVECSGLAFYELGKIGYKVSLSEDNFYNDDYSWFSGERDSDGNLLFEEQPVANIQYWLNKFLKPYSDEDLSAAQWYYKIQMNWDLTADFSKFKKDSDKIYENDVYGDTYLPSQEKYRMVNLEESNFYNLTQNIAETFGVYCRYVYSYDENYHIIGRTIVFYNNFLNEEKLSINYRGNTQSISRELDTTDLITKMYVKSVDNSGDTISIIDVNENDSGEDYLLNFDYLHSIGSIDDDDYNQIEPYKQNLKVLNTQLKSISDRIISLENKLPEVRARLSLAQDSIPLDKEKINNTNKLLMNLTNGDNEIEITANNPDTAVLMPDDGDRYYIKITRQGVEFSTLQIFRTFSLSSGKYGLSEKILTGIPVYDEAHNLVKINNIYWTEDDERKHRSKIVYLTYKYNPADYYENVKKTWENKLQKDELEVEKASQELEALETELNDAISSQKTLLAEKEELNNNFEKIMGPAIREGYWQPEEYSEYAQTFVSSYNISTESEGTSHLDSFVWDSELFDGEQQIYYEQGIGREKKYYPCIKLSISPGGSIDDSTIWDKIYNDLDSLNFIFYDTNNTEQYNAISLRVLAFGSGAKIVFLRKDDRVAPYLLLPGLESYSSESIDYAKANGVIGFIQYVDNGGRGYVISSREDDRNGISINSNWWESLNSDYEIVYPRIRIESSSLKTDTNTLIVKDNKETILSQYIDYYVNNRVEDSKYLGEEDNRPLATTYYVTIKPEVIAKKVGLSEHTLEIMFQLSNYGAAIYKDAIEVLKDNSKPKVSYESTIDIFNKNVIKRPSYFLSKLVKINDYDLLLDNAWGYVSGVTLDLDHPENDSIEIQNYTNKFEDLFTTIVAQTEEMKRTSYIVNSLSNSFAPDGTLSENTLKNSFSKVDLNYAFNNGTLNIDEANGIWGISDSGVVAFRGGGIFTATERDKRNNWVWNTGITPEGINADLITTGQLDTNKIKVFAGDRERFQLNGDGLYAYKTFISDFDIFFKFNEYKSITEKINKNDTLDPAQFVRFDENGLFLVAKEGAYVLNKERTFYTVINHDVLDEDEELKRVAITWDGLSLKNLNGDKVFYADPDSGDLLLKGSVFADGFFVVDDEDGTNKRVIDVFVRQVSTQELYDQLKKNRDVGLRIKDYISSMSGMIAGKHLKTMEEKIPETHVGNSFPASYSIGDYFYKNNGEIYICISEDSAETKDDWELLTVLSDDAKASMSVDAINGTIKLFSSKEISMVAMNEEDYSIFTIKPDGIDIGSNKTISLTSGANIDINSGGMFSAIGGKALIATSSDWESNDTSNYIYMHYDSGVKKEVLEIATDDLRLKSGGNFTVEAGGQVSINAGGSISLLSSTTGSSMSGVKLSGGGIDVYSDAYLHVATNNFTISTLTDTGIQEDVNFDTYVENTAHKATSGLVQRVEVEYAANNSPTTPPAFDDESWSTVIQPSNGLYIWQHTVTYTVDSTAPSYSQAICISDKNSENNASYNIEYSSIPIKDSEGNITPSTITISAHKYINGQEDTSYSGGIFKIYWLINSSKNLYISFRGKTFPLDTHIIPENTEKIIIELYEKNSTLLLDKKELSIIGNDEYYVDLSNDYHVFPGGTSLASNGYITLSFKGYYGNEQCRITTYIYSTLPDGMHVTIDNKNNLINYATINIDKSLKPSAHKIRFFSSIKRAGEEETHIIYKSFTFEILLNEVSNITNITPLYYISDSETTPDMPLDIVTNTNTQNKVWTTTCGSTNETYPYIFTCNQINYVSNDKSWVVWSKPVKNQTMIKLNERVTQAELAVTKDSIIAKVTGSFVEKETMIIEDTEYYLVSEQDSGIGIYSSGWSTIRPSVSESRRYLWSYHEYLCTDGHIETTTPEIVYNWFFNGNTNHIDRIDTFYAICPKDTELSYVKDHDELFIQFQSDQNFDEPIEIYSNSIFTRIRLYSDDSLIAEYTRRDANYNDTSRDSNIDKVCIKKFVMHYYLKDVNHITSSSNRLLLRSTTTFPINLTESKPIFTGYVLHVNVAYYKEPVYNEATETYDTYTTIFKPSTTYYKKNEIIYQYYPKDTSVANVVDYNTIYYLSDNSSIPSIPDAWVTTSDLLKNQWTLSFQIYENSFSHLYKCKQFLKDDNTFYCSTPEELNLVVDMNSRIQKTELAITDGEIRMQAQALVWKAENSEMSADGTLRISRAIIDGVWSGVYNDNGIRDGLLLGRAQIIGLQNGENIFNILMPYASDNGPMSIDSYTDSDGEVVSQPVEMSIPEIETFIGAPTSLQEDENFVYFNTTGKHGLCIGTNQKANLIFSNDGKYLWINVNRIYAGPGGTRLL